MENILTKDINKKKNSLVYDYTITIIRIEKEFMPHLVLLIVTANQMGT